MRPGAARHPLTHGVTVDPYPSVDDFGAVGHAALSTEHDCATVPVERNRGLRRWALGTLCPPGFRGPGDTG